MAEKSESYLRFDDLGYSASGKTRMWRVCSADGTLDLGNVSWFSPWRKYCFYPSNATVFDAGCLDVIRSFLDDRTQEHKARKATA